jgi:hypothetical protein
VQVPRLIGPKIPWGLVKRVGKLGTLPTEIDPEHNTFVSRPKHHVSRHHGERLHQRLGACGCSLGSSKTVEYGYLRLFPSLIWPSRANCGCMPVQVLAISVITSKSRRQKFLNTLEQRTTHNAQPIDDRMNEWIEMQNVSKVQCLLVELSSGLSSKVLLAPASGLPHFRQSSGC